jgi:hypothetical protein
VKLLPGILCRAATTRQRLARLAVTITIEGTDDLVQPGVKGGTRATNKHRSINY